MRVAGGAGLGWIICSCVIACGDSADAPATAASVVRDSAGVQIVENDRPQWAAGTGWRLAETPTVVIGDAPGDELTDVVGATRLSDGRIVVGVAEAREMRVYDSTGVRRGTIGRTGRGPGEFGALSAIWKYRGDSLLAYEGGMRRLFSVFAGTGAFAEGWFAAGVDTTARFIVPIGPLADGRIVARTMNVITPAPARLVERPLTAVYAFGPRWDNPKLVTRATDGPRFRDPNAVMLGETFFGPQPVVAVSGSALLVAVSDTAEFRVVSLDGAVQRVVRWRATAEPVTPAHIARESEKRVTERRRLFGNAPALQKQFIENGLIPAIAAMPMPATFPHFSAMRADAAGNVWLFPYLPSGDVSAGATAATVFDSTGKWLGPVLLPARFRALEIDSEHLIGVRLDSNDVPRVELYRLRKA